MTHPVLLLASGDPALFAMLAAVLLLVGAAFGLGLAGVILVVSRNEDRRKLGRRLLLAALLPVIVGAIAWVAFAGID